MKGTITRAAIAAAAVLVLAAPAGAGPTPGTTQARSISGESPFLEACTPMASSAGRRHMEQEPSMAVNPTDSRNMAVAWIEDWGDGIVVGVTHDGGETWTKVVPPNFNWCSGGAGFNSAINPHLAYAPDGRLYLTSFVLDSFAPISGINVTTSTDGGLTWSPAQLLDRASLPERFLDFSWVVADPVRANRAYAAWLSFEFEDCTPVLCVPNRVAMLFSRTTDGGATWSSPQEISPTPPGKGRGPTRIVALPDGTLVNIFGELEMCPDVPACLRQQRLHTMASRSTDGGLTWSEPVTVAADVPLDGTTDPDISKLDTPQANLPAVGPDGTIYFAWSEFAPDGPDGLSQLKLTKSSDGGRTWSKVRVAMSSKSPLMNPNIAVAADGTFGVFFYDFRNDVQGDDELTADAWLATSRSARVWTETHLAGPFDARTIPPGPDDDIGSYQGIAGTAEGFVTAFTAAKPLATAGPTDILYAEVAA